MIGKECCSNCKYLKDLWWFTYKEDGHIDQKHYGKACDALDEVCMKIDQPDRDMCEMFTQRSDEDD